MNKNWITLILINLVRFIFLATGTLTAQEEAPEEIMIGSKSYKRKVHQPVQFAHLVHVEDYGPDCTECHHNYKDGENVWEEGDPAHKCAVCHNPKKQGNVPPRLGFAFHFNCKNCHEENEAGPIEYKKCHTKE